jgi:ABC-type multidrug transport system fused ATPase/permease subunit
VNAAVLEPALQPASGIARYPLLRCFALYRTMPWRFSRTALLFLVGNLSLAYQQWVVGRAVHDVERGVAVVRLSDGSLDYDVGLRWLLLLLAVALGRGVVQYLSGLSALIIGQDLLQIIRVRILEQVQRLDLAYHRANGVGGMVTRTTRDADKMRDALVNFWRQVIETSILIVACVGMLCFYHPWLGLVPLLLTTTGMGIFVLQTGQLVTLDRAVGQAYDLVNQNLTEGVSGVRVVKAFGLEQHRTEGFSGHVTSFTDHAARALRYATSRIPIPQAVVALGHVWVLGLGAVLVGQGRLNIGELVASLLLANTLVLRIEGVGRVMQIFADARSSAARIWEVLDARPRHPGGKSALPAGPLGIRVHGATIAKADAGKFVLENVSIQIDPGEIVALVGNTGSGKSSLMSLLPRLTDVDEGQVEIGSDAGGWHDVLDVPDSDLRRRVHVVAQESFLFSDTLRANLLMARPDATDEELLEALRMASAEDVLDRLENGLDTRIGDRGITLSGGQRQRICLARAFLSRASVLGLDDATSALDATTERKVLSNLRDLQNDRERVITVLIVSSKLSTVLLADRVLVVVDGRLVAQGTHRDLALQSADYRELMGI